jgi:hypothetical protein
MKTLTAIFMLALLTYCGILKADIPHNSSINNRGVTIQRVLLNPGNISAWFQNTGIFDQDTRTINTPGFEWIKGSHKFALFTTGITVGAIVNNSFRMAAASYGGEYGPGIIINGIVHSDTIFKIYSVKSGDNAFNNPDWANWGLMVPYGAPYYDVNSNGMYEANIDTPGVKGASQTLFMCLTDGDPATHNAGEGFGGGTSPLKAELRLTAWAYANSTPTYPGLNDIQFIKGVFINKGDSSWNKTYLGLVSDPDIGEALDDYIGCDTTLSLGYAYNFDNTDGDGTGYTYGANPPAAGFTFLQTPQNLGMTSFVYFTSTSSSPPPCESDPNAEPNGAYNMLKGLKKDSTQWVNPLNHQLTKFCYTGDPETTLGWTEKKGSVQNCNRQPSGTILAQNPAGDRRLVMNSGSDALTFNPGDTNTIVFAQLIARGTSNLNSVTKLKALTLTAKNLFATNFVIGINPVSSEIPGSFRLYQNYPNPFNPVTNIKFDIPKSSPVKIAVYDISGREISTLVNEQLSAGSYDINWNGSEHASGVYFYKLETGSFTEVKKMVLVK